MHSYNGNWQNSGWWTPNTLNKHCFGFFVNQVIVGNFNPKFQPVRNKTNRENTRQRKQSQAQDNIYVVRQFAYVHEVAGISL